MFLLAEAMLRVKTLLLFHYNIEDGILNSVTYGTCIFYQKINEPQLSYKRFLVQRCVLKPVVGHL